MSPHLDLRVMSEPQEGATYDDLLAAARTAEDCGYSGFFRSDHLLRTDAPTAKSSRGPSDAWLTLAALARETSTIRLGTLVTSATFRLPGLLAIQVAGVDQMSAGRVELGLGAGWFEREHRATGIEFPDVRERFDRFEEQLEIITGLWGTPDGETYSFSGEHYRLEESPAWPKPVQSPLPIIIGGKGRTRTPALAARYAGEFNTVGVSADVMAERNERVAAACRAIERDPATMTYSTYQSLICGRDDAEVARRIEPLGKGVEELRADGYIVGSPDQCVQALGEYAEAGASRVYLDTYDLADLDHLELIAASVRPQL
jgi:F420-dependent oxidoreductase-like protein